MAINLTDFDKIWASSSPLTPYSFSDANYEEGWNFVGATPPARQMWDGYMKWSDEKQQWIVNNFLPLAGGTMTGTINTSESQALKKTDSDNYIQINSGVATADGSSLVMCAKNYSGTLGAGAFQLTARDSNEYKTLYGKPDGTLAWNNIRIAFEYLGSASNGVATNFTLPNTGWWLVVCGHNSTAGLNGIFAVRTGGNSAFKLAGAGNITMTCSGTTITVTPSSGATQVVCLQLPAS